MKMAKILHMNPKQRAALCVVRCCCVCQEPMSSTFTGRHVTSGGEMCSDCYYEALGNLVEEMMMAPPAKRESA